MSGDGTTSGSCPCPNPCGLVTISKGYAKVFILDLFYADTRSPYDLTGATQIVAAFPAAAAGPPVTLQLTAAEIVVQGSPGAGRIQVKLSAVKSALLLLNPIPLQNQDLQIAVTNADTSVSPFSLQAVLNIAAPPYGVV